MSRSFAKLAEVTASTKRSALDAGEGKVGTPTENIASMSITPLDPVAPELRQRLAIDTPHQLLRTFATGDLDIKRGDLLVVGSNEYPIKDVSEFTWQSTTYHEMIVEDLER